MWKFTIYIKISPRRIRLRVVAQLGRLERNPIHEVPARGRINSGEKIPNAPKKKVIGRSSAAAIRPSRLAGGRSTFSWSCSPTTRPRRAGGRSVGPTQRHSAPSGRRHVVARSVCPAQPLTGTIDPAGGRRTVGQSGAAATRPERPAGGCRMVGRSGAVATRPRGAGGMSSHGRSGRRSPPPGPARPARGRLTVGRSGTAVARSRRAG